jgi:hypothetical protein
MAYLAVPAEQIIVCHPGADPLFVRYTGSRRRRRILLRPDLAAELRADPVGSRCGGLRLERGAIRAASRRRASRFTWHHFARRIDEERSPKVPRSAHLEHSRDHRFSAAARRGQFELIAELRRQRQAEIVRITGIAARLTGGFGAGTAVGFLYYEILGRSPDREDLLSYAERLRRTSSVLPIIVEESLP